MGSAARARLRLTCTPLDDAFLAGLAGRAHVGA